MKPNFYKIINDWSKSKFDQKCEGHYTGIEIYSNENANGLYLQRDTRTKELRYARWSNRKINIGIIWELMPVRDSKGKWVRDDKGYYRWELGIKRIWIDLYFPPFSWISRFKQWRKDRKEWKRKKAMLESGEYSMDPMGVIHHIDDDQAAYYE